MPEAAALPEVSITGLSVDAEGIGRLPDGRVVFVDGAVPGDRVRVRPIGTRRRLVLAELVDIVAPSPERVQAGCDVWACGGCPMRMVSMAQQARSKAEQLASCMGRIGGVPVDAQTLTVAQVGDGWRYRHRVRLHAAWSPGADGAAGHFSLGYLRRHSRALVPLSMCPVVWPELERLGRAVASCVARLPREAALHTVELAYSRRDGRGSARFVAHGPMQALAHSPTWLEGSELGGWHIEAADGQYRHGAQQLRYDHAHSQAFDLRFEPGHFTQANPEANALLVAHVLDHVAPRSGQRVLELHSGIGNFSLPMARMGAQVTAVERSVPAATMLESNAERAGVRIDVHARDDVWATALLAQAPDVLLMDPARGGAREVAEAIGELGAAAPAHIVYVSCDPATLARDAARIMRAGLRLHSLWAVDAFAQTPHLESVATFRR